MRLERVRDEKAEWVAWLNTYGPEKFLEAFQRTVADAESTCRYCGELIYVDVLVGGGVPDWSTRGGDFGCGASPDTDEDGTGGHSPIRR